MIKFVVDTEEEKQQLLEASRHIHDLRNVNMELPMVNTIGHLYLAPHLIVVKHSDEVLVS